MELLLVPASRFATWLVDNINRLLTTLGLDRTPAVEQISYIVVIVAVAVCLGWALRHILLFIARKYVAIRHGQVGRELLNHKVLERTSQIIPPLVILACLPIAFETKSRWLSISERALVIYSIIMTVLAICAIFDFIWNRYNDKNNEKHPLKGILISAKGVIWIVATIVVVSVMVDKSPATLLAGLGAFAAALMLIFKDSILGFVAGVQLSQNDMLRVGDWIVVPSTQANGIVIDVSLIAVKVQNWDNTIVTLPPYTLISNSFQNWRGMSESGVRQIVRSLTVVATSIKTIDAAFIDAIAARLGSLDGCIAKIKDANGAQTFNPGVAAVNGTTTTNLGLFRAYLCQYLIDNKMISDKDQILVRTLAPTPEGLPLNIYCYVASTEWTTYEAVQSALFEQIAILAPIFDLRVYNSTSDNTLFNVESVPGAPSSPSR